MSQKSIMSKWLILFLSFIGINCNAQRVSISSVGGKILHYGYPNTVVITIENYSCSEIKLSSNDAYIEHYSNDCSFKINPMKIGQMNIAVSTNRNGDSALVGIYQLTVKKLPTPPLTIEKKKTNDTITISDLKNAKYISFDRSEIFVTDIANPNILTYKILLLRNDSVIARFFSDKQSSFGQDFMDYKKSNLKAGDCLLLYDVKGYLGYDKKIFDPLFLYIDSDVEYKAIRRKGTIKEH